MDGFYTTILTVASIILILLLTYVGILLYYAKGTEVFPPNQKPCPDYWVMNADGKCVFPLADTSRNRGSLGDSIDKYKLSTTAVAGTPGYTVGTVGANGAVTGSTIDFSNAGWKTKYGKPSELCNKKRWSEIYNIEWDGVTNTNQC